MKYLLLTALLIINLSAFSQNNKLGIKAGYNLSNQIEPVGLDYQPLSSFHFGVSYHLRASQKIAFQPELLFSIKGSRHNEGELKLKHLEVPLLITYKINKFSLLAGPQYSLLFNAKWDGETGSYKENYNLSNIGFILGLAYSLNDNFLFGARYQRDLFDNFALLEYYPSGLTQKNATEDPSIPSGLPFSHTQAFQVYFSYSFKLNKD
ncbi:MAG: porin family protein [Vicingaceae bacterium]